MSDYISRSKLIKDVESLQDCYNGFSDTYDKACIIGLIAEQPSIEELQKPKWIPVTKRLPESKGTVLICMKCRIMAISFFNPKSEDMWGFSDVTHWMPLPQPPESDGE